ncbi:MAG: 4Fe-4S binding protein [Caldilineaceae bacterium]
MRLLSQRKRNRRATLSLSAWKLWIGERLMREVPLPRIDQSLCTGCHRCVDICPTQALAQADGKAYLRDVDRCTYCTACEEVCPVNAIALPFLIVLATPAENAGDANRKKGGKPGQMARLKTRQAAI